MKLSLGLILEKVVLTFSEELLLRHIKELLVAETELSFHLGDLSAKLLVLFLNFGKILKSVEFAAPCDGCALDRESI